MKLFLLKRHDKCDYDEFDSFVCAAEDEAAARSTHPSNADVHLYAWAGTAWRTPSGYEPYRDGGWINPEFVKVKLLGTAVKSTTAGVICASFNGG